MEPAIRITRPGTEAEAYPVYIGSGMLSRLSEAIPSSYSRWRRFLVTDANVAAHRHAERLNPDPACTYVIDPPGEIAKKIDTVTRILRVMERAGLGRDTLIIALGGGTVGDIAGFAASVFKRGVPVLHIPTTTVSQADSAIGGKTGVNSAHAKNVIGTFCDPCCILIDTDTLATLDDRHYRAGLAESVKHGLVRDADFFAYMERGADAIRRRDADALAKLARNNCRIKGEVAAADPRERNLRSILNFGHTFGHALETASGYELFHGEAVSLGMIFAVELGMALGVTPPEVKPRVLRLLDALSLPARIPDAWTFETLLDVMKQDKKALASNLRFALLSGVGRMHAANGAYAHPVDEMVLKQTFQSLARSGV
jgi:3-dehydroquinate synthase